MFVNGEVGRFDLAHGVTEAQEAQAGLERPPGRLLSDEADIAGVVFKGKDVEARIELSELLRVQGGKRVRFVSHAEG